MLFGAPFTKKPNPSRNMTGGRSLEFLTLQPCFIVLSLPPLLASYPNNCLRSPLKNDKTSQVKTLRMVWTPPTFAQKRPTRIRPSCTLRPPVNSRKKAIYFENQGFSFWMSGTGQVWADTGLCKVQASGPSTGFWGSEILPMVSGFSGFRLLGILGAWEYN